MHNLKGRFPIYSRLIKLYPTPYQKEYGEQILQTTADMLDNSPTVVTKAGVWMHITFDLSLNVMKQQLYYSGGTYNMKQTPGYIKQSSVISGLLLVPFFVTFIASSIGRHANNQALHNSWLWKSPFVAIWMIYLPEVALLLALVSYIVFLSRRTTIRSRLLERLRDLKHTWMVIVPIVLALGILFVIGLHDVGGCWLHSPIHISHAWQCTVENQSLTIFRKYI
jgi:hypothetical protein